MNDRDWATGWADLQLSYPEREEMPETKASRAGLYRRHVDDLDGPAWLYAVEHCIASSKWFPTVAELRDAALAYRPPVAGLLQTSQRPPEEVEAERAEARAAAKKGLEMVKAAVAEAQQRGAVVVVKAEPAQPMPKPSDEVEERLALLRRQREQVMAAPAVEEA